MFVWCNTELPVAIDEGDTDEDGGSFVFLKLVDEIVEC